MVGIISNIVVKSPVISRGSEAHAVSMIITLLMTEVMLHLFLMSLWRGCSSMILRCWVHDGKVLINMWLCHHIVLVSSPGLGHVLWSVMVARTLRAQLVPGSRLHGKLPGGLEL